MPAAASGDEARGRLVGGKGVRVRLPLGLDEVVQARELPVRQLQLLLLDAGDEIPLRRLAGEFQRPAGDGPGDGVGVSPARPLSAPAAGGPSLSRL